MIQYSFSTVLMATLCCNLMVVFLFLVFHVKNVLPEFGLKLTGFFLILVVIRLLLPIEIPVISNNVYFPPGISRIIALFQQPRFLTDTVSWWNLLEIAWVAGCIGIGLYRIIVNYKAFRIIKSMSKYPEERCLSIMRKIGIEIFQAPSYSSKAKKKVNQRIQQISVGILPGSHSPMVCGLWKPCIFLPEDLKLSDEELYYVLKHETQHIIHHDLWLKLGVQFLVVLYWWNPFCWLLERYLNCFLEMRVDLSMANNPKQKAAYLTCLLNIIKQTGTTPKRDSSLAIHFCASNSSILKQRFELILNTERKYERAHRTWFRIAAISGILLLFICSFLLIFEAHYMTPEIQEETILYDEKTSFFIDNQDGTYDFYIAGQYIETVDSLEYYDPNIPVYNSLEEVK